MKRDDIKAACYKRFKRFTVSQFTVFRFLLCWLSVNSLIQPAPLFVSLKAERLWCLRAPAAQRPTHTSRVCWVFPAVRQEMLFHYPIKENGSQLDLLFGSCARTFSSHAAGFDSTTAGLSPQVCLVIGCSYDAAGCCCCCCCVTPTEETEGQEFNHCSSSEFLTTHTHTHCWGPPSAFKTTEFENKSVINLWEIVRITQEKKSKVYKNRVKKGGLAFRNLFWRNIMILFSKMYNVSIFFFLTVVSIICPTSMCLLLYLLIFHLSGFNQDVFSKLSVWRF